MFRVEFHQITKDAIASAFSSPREIDMDKVDAQQARRILDRIVGYSISPLLWKKVSYGLSAGRVQSVAVRLIVEREKRVRAFMPQEYWEIEADLSRKVKKEHFKSSLDKIDNKKPAIDNKEKADKIVEELKSCAYSVSNIKQTKKTRKAPPPYTTSKIQQDSYNKLRFSAERTMRIAQQLYEGLETGGDEAIGLITYMRTDSINIAKSAQDEAAAYIKKEFGEKFLPKTPNQFRSKQHAQAAHEAIRPTSALRTPDKLKKFLSTDQYKLYNLIWQRFIQSQMKAAILSTKTIEITAQQTHVYLFKTTGTHIVFEGFLKVVSEKEKSDYPNIPDLAVKEALNLLQLTPSQHFTKPPARYTDASLIKDLEEKGIGRPSTYAPTISTIINRHYIKREKGALFPTQLGELINGLLVKSFPNIVDVKFTAKMEDELDKVAAGTMKWQDALANFYTPFSKSLTIAQKKMEDVKKKEETTKYKCETCGRRMVLKWSRRGRFLSCSGFPRCKSAKRIKEKEDGGFEIVEDEKTDQICDKCQKPMVIKYSKHGRFLSCSDYPKCKNAKPIPTGVKCPQENCSGELLERYGRGRIFYGCSKYPDCKYTAKKLPEKT